MTDSALAQAYLSAMALPPQTHARLAAELRAGEQSENTSMRWLHEVLAGANPSEDQASTPGEGYSAQSISARLALAYPQVPESVWASPMRALNMPPVHHWGMEPQSIDRRFGNRVRDWLAAIPKLASVLSAAKPAVRTAAFLRQLLLLLLVMVPGLSATAYMATVLPHKGSTGIEIAILLCAFVLFAWILVGFWTAILGFWVLLFGDKYRLKHETLTDAVLPADVRTAILMPICDEDVARCFAGLRVVIESLAQDKVCAKQFDVFILSDSGDPGRGVDEERAWAELCRELNAFGRIFYRRRRARIKRKSGNIADFCRRWGAAYRYMIILDADSIMTGEAIIKLAHLMQQNPGAGLIQTAPVAVNRHSPLARIQQFSTRAYGPIFCAGLHFWHLDNAHYWGHNAIIRIEPFMQHCSLARLPGGGSMGGEILSHDFVEAALMRRAGWGVYLAYDLPGSYEELPPTLLDELRRDRRWCQGNMQHLRLLFSDRLAPAHRALFANGVMAYASALIWFVFLLLSSTEVVMEALRPLNYFPKPGALFPVWPVWQPLWAISLFAATMVVLFLPKILGWLRILWRGEARSFGGFWALTGSVLLEIVLTTLLAPVRMLSHTRFVVTTLMGRSVRWTSQQRADTEVAWSSALRYHGPGMVLAAAWGGIICWANLAFLPWLLPILFSLLVAPVVSVLSSRVSLGRGLARRGLAEIPEEHEPPAVLLRLQALLSGGNGAQQLSGFAAAALDPTTNALHSRLLSAQRGLTPAIQAQRKRLREIAFKQGPAGLSAEQQTELLSDPVQMQQLHEQLWATPNWPQAWQASADVLAKYSQDCAVATRL